MRVSALDVLLAFFRLGLTSFGGPVAHLGYFRQEFVVKRGWIDEPGYADIVALCQFLPGPASSQVGFALGLRRAGAWGGLAAWVGFTLPSAIALIAFAYAASLFDGPVGAAILHGLKLVAVAVVAQAVWGMAKTLCPDRTRGTIGALAAMLVLLVGGAFGQIAAIVLGGAAGLAFLSNLKAPETGHLAFPISRTVGIVALVLFAILLLGLPLLASIGSGGVGLALFDGFYRSGALVFGGGHVVLPLLQEQVVPQFIGADSFLAGYGAAQAVPGPLFTFAAYLGTVIGSNTIGPIAAIICLIAIFLPGLLLVVGAMPFWEQFRTLPKGRAIMAGANAAVVGILGAALYDPVWTSAVIAPVDVAIALAGFGLLVLWKAPPTLVVGVVLVISVLSGLMLG
ncbi:chromate efflux transporter [Devosia rhodophyticola]|uniref:Chromate efflux transporter n=1 Tax=Devosia rhodophyticola TaxID=3026423 RepID=A0ABY7Z303_9HYPH|nr:chromate efflux transporter [Devosia rhodophyticola]WDR07479.1 chromate efflux transporter [Devosia rhodophyticola]